MGRIYRGAGCKLLLLVAVLAILLGVLARVVGTVWLCLLIFAAFLALLLLFRHTLRRMGRAAGALARGGGEPVPLPPNLPLAAEFSDLQCKLRLLEAGNRESAQKKNHLIAFLAHDLKTPLTSVKGYLSLLREQPELDAAQREKYIGIALDKTVRLEELLEEFFDISRLHLDGEEEERVPLQLSILLEQLADEFYPLFAEKGLTYVSEISPHLQVAGVPDKLARVFDNILRNAVSYSIPNGIVLMRAQPIGDRVEITVRNEGLEIPEGELAHIFERFYRLDAARSSRTGGAGLGLAIAREIVEGHGGSIRAECNGSFTSFLISLPRLPRAAGL